MTVILVEASGSVEQRTHDRVGSGDLALELEGPDRRVEVAPPPRSTDRRPGDWVEVVRVWLIDNGGGAVVGALTAEVFHLVHDWAARRRRARPQPGRSLEVTLLDAEGRTLASLRLADDEVVEQPPVLDAPPPPPPSPPPPEGPASG